MKKTLLTVLLATASAITFADGSFTGAGLEVGAGATKSDVRNVNLNEKTKGDVAVRGSYNTQFGQSNWIGGVEAGVKPLHRKIAGNAKQKVDANVSYVQGYRLTDNALAYGKVGYHYGRFDNLGAVPREAALDRPVRAAPVGRRARVMRSAWWITGLRISWLVWLSG